MRIQLWWVYAVGMKRTTIQIKESTLAVIEDLAELEDSTKSAVIREILETAEVRLGEIVKALKHAKKVRLSLDEVGKEEFEMVQDELTKINLQASAALAKVEGFVTAKSSAGTDNRPSRLSNQGGDGRDYV